MAGGFQANTRQVQRFNQTKPAVYGQPAEWQLPNVGLLSRLMVSIAGVINVIHAANPTVTQADFGPWNFVQRVRVFANGGITFVDLSGWDLYLENLTRNVGAIFDVYSANDPTVYRFENAAAAGPGGADNDINFTFVIPISLNDRDGIGLFLLQNPTTQVTVRIDFNDPEAAGVLYKTLAGYTLAAGDFTASLSIEHFSVPPDPQDFPAINTVVATVSQKQTVAAAGAHEFQALLGNVWTKVIAYAEASAIPLDPANISMLSLKYNQTETPYYLRPETVRRDMRDMYGRIFPASTFVLDFNHQGIPQLGTARDFINTGAITDLRLITDVSGGTPFDLHVITQQIINLNE